MAHPSDQKHAAASGLMHDVAVAAAQQKAMEQGGKSLSHGSRLFEVEQGWESGMIRRDPAVAVAETLLTLEAAFRDPEKKVVFIPLGALVTMPEIEKIAHRNAATRTLFKEVKKS